MPKAVSHTIKEHKTDDELFIKRGAFTIRNKQTGVETKVVGEIWFVWYPQWGVKFISKQFDSIDPSYFAFPELEFIDLAEYDFRLSKIQIGSDGYLEGFISNYIDGDGTVPVTEIRFCIPNFIKILGTSSFSLDKTGATRNTIHIHSKLLGELKCNKLLTAKDKLSSGNTINWVGSLTLIKPHTRTDTHDLIRKLRLFFSFISGLNTCPIYIEGLFDGTVIWTDYSVNAITDSYSERYKWAPTNEIIDLTSIFETILHSGSSSFPTLDHVSNMISWHLSSTIHNLDKEVVITQILLEYLYNIYIVDHLGIIQGRDSENISAANKIRLLLNQIGMTSKYPNELIGVFPTNYKDMADAFSGYRNFVVHSNSKEDHVFKGLDPLNRFAVLHGGRLFSTLGILYILGYSGVVDSQIPYSPLSSDFSFTTPWK